MKTFETTAERAGSHVRTAWFLSERTMWLAVVCLLGALLLVRAGIAPDQTLRLANPLALALFAAFYVLIRIREAGGRF